MAKKKTWAEKLENGKEPHVTVLEKGFAGLKPGQRLFIGTPMLIKDCVEAIPAGKTKTVKELRAELAEKNGADAMCPASTGIFLRIVAEAALDQMAAGKTSAEVTPFWRLVEPNSPLANKLSCGPEFVDIQRKMEAG